MKNQILLLLFWGASFFAHAQQTTTRIITHDGLQRTYLLYIPASYTGNTAVPLVFNFHGYNSSPNDQMWYGDFRSIADTANFILVHPEGTVFDGATHWNVEGWIINSPIDDVGFTEAMIDELSAEFNIDAARVYATGMSNGGFMSFLLACQLSEKIAAVASVTGSMTPQTFAGCDPQHPTPILQMHGTVDGVVPYTGAAWTNPIDAVIQYWVDYNHCNTSPIINPLPNITTTDGSTVEHIVYSGGDQGATTEHFKITGGGHTWPGTIFGSTSTNQDINASLEIWKFFSRYDLNGLTTTVNEIASKHITITIYPNPTQSTITVETTTTAYVDFEVISLLGQQKMSGRILAEQLEIDLSPLPPNLYFLKIGNQTFKILKTD